LVVFAMVVPVPLEEEAEEVGRLVIVADIEKMSVSAAAGTTPKATTEVADRWLYHDELASARRVAANSSLFKPGRPL
jgi:hypothetical protein